MTRKNRPPVHTPHSGAPTTKSTGQTTQIVELQGTAWSGPLPPPEVLQGYEAIQPGFAERIMNWAEREGDHRRGLNNREQIIRAVLDGLGLLVSGALCGWALWLAFRLLEAGHDVAGFAALVSALVPLVGALMLAKRLKR